MKYADKLELLKIKSWNNKYIDYKLLKKILKKEKNAEIRNIYNTANKNDEKIKSLCNACSHLSKEKNYDVMEKIVKEKRNKGNEGNERNEIIDKTNNKEIDYNDNNNNNNDNNNNVREQDDVDFGYLFFFVLENYMNIVKDHYQQEYIYLEKKLNEIITFLNNNVINEKDAHILKKNCLNIYNMFDILNNYLNINILSAYKILKKKNKKEKNSDALKLYESYYSHLSEISKEETFNEKIKVTFLSIQKKLGVDCENLDLINFKIYVKNQIENVGKYKGVILFLSGISLTLIINIFIMCYLKLNPQNINIMLSILPVYRLIYIFTFFPLFVFGSLIIMQSYGVNFTYILDLNKIVVEDYYYLINYLIFYLFLTTISLLIFLMDVLFGLNIFKNLFFHVLILFTLIFFLSFYPFNFITLKKGSFIWASFIRVLLSGLFLVDSVNLMDNIMGDVLTSLSKTFSDIQYLICFIMNRMNTDKPSKCPMMERYITPFFLGLPFYLRFCQCLIRYKKEKNNVHIYNMLKYVSGMAIVLCTSINWKYWGISVYTSKLILVFAYVIGSTFMYIWDIYMDWGLLTEYDQLLRKNNNIMYPPYYYYIGGLFNLIFRLTWAITVMPVSIFENQEINSFLITFFVMFIEIFRRAIWICFRLENEHITNASKYRAILWVPKLYKAKEF